MKPFERAYIPEEEVKGQMDALQKAWIKDRCRTLLNREATEEEYKGMLVASAQMSDNLVFKNDIYQVMVSQADNPDFLELSIKRIDRKPIHDWRHLQQIKNELVGPEHEALELYPAESRLVDSANQYYLWVLKKPGLMIPVGFPQRVVSQADLGKSKNRPFENAPTAPAQ